MNKPFENVAATGAALRLNIDGAHYLGLAAAPERIARRLSIAVSPRAYLPEIDDLRSDWVASVAVPAFKLVRQRQGVQPAFCAIGTGVGLDALSAIETLGATRVGITDVHEEVVAAARANILANLQPTHPVRVESGHGDLFEPLRDLRPRYDLIYENLPNIPIEDAERIAHARTSSSHLPPRTEEIPALVRAQLLSLHYLALQQAHDFLEPGGAVLSMLGSRIPLAVYEEMARLAGHRGEIYTYGWKLQADAEAVLQGHAAQQRAGYGPFHFYRAGHLADAFAGVDLATSGEQAHAIEARLAPARLDPQQAWDALQRGEPIGHTFVVLRSRPERSA
ncbi:class I SAM-dependent methyltransferase [Pseudothauera rhizosphaerae]|uniref:Uncharacterized protein n=1 Tax=Pseudothauera rhizosphaerae TaxID=2565932 RepID=A0A4S4AYU8_9RHOO|nr:hypothetical protein [Pseudothauera rhizosphaerae]THF65290.1 hypothetical protein E6O51_01425 [Pseudothauera rhizosphaerae]